MDKSLITPLRGEGLTTLRLLYNWKTDGFMFQAAREWDEEIVWKNYKKDFTYESFLTKRPHAIYGDEVLAMYEIYDLGENLDMVLGLMRQGKHEGIELFYNDRLGIRFYNNMHSSTLGIDNGRHAIRAGGIRRHDLADDEMEVIVDGLNLARGMSFKNAAAQMPFGGNKTTVHSEFIELDDLERLGFIAYCIDRSRHFTGPDMGFLPDHADVLREHFTKNIVGGPKGAMGPTGTPTAYGAFLAIKEACAFRYGKPDIAGRTVAIQGLGAVGFPLAELLIKNKAKLIVADIVEKPVLKLCEMHPGADITVVKGDKIFAAQADIFAPCAIGGIITEERIETMKFEIIMGVANNALKATSSEQEIEMAKKLHDRNVLYQIEWMQNTAGVMAGWEEYINQENARMENIMPHIEKVCTMGVRRNLRDAKERNITPTENAYRHIESQIYR